jgi:tRNA synthetases class II (A)
MEAEQVSHLKKAEVPTTNDLPKYEWYQSLETEVLALYTSQKEFPEEVKESDGQVGLIVRETSFYAESGGQVADTGIITVGETR